MTPRPVVLTVLAAGLLQAAPPAFDVATLKPVQLTGAGLYYANLGKAIHGEVTLTNATLSDCLRYAYSISNDAQIQGPDWIRNKDIRFDIVARSAPDTPLDQLLLMLQTLLAERFHLQLHREPKEISYLALMPGKKGSQLHPASDPTDAVRRSSIPGRIISNRMSMSLLATLLSRFMRQTVVDLTNLQGAYEINLVWTPENLHPNSEPTDTPAGPSIFTAIHEQLGLKLEARKGPLDVLVVDQAEKVPAEN